MTSSQLKANVGRSAYLRSETLMIEVEITESRVDFGKIRYQVRPVSGRGEQWVDESRILFAAGEVN